MMRGFVFALFFAVLLSMVQPWVTDASAQCPTCSNDSCGYSFQPTYTVPQFYPTSSYPNAVQSRRVINQGAMETGICPGGTCAGGCGGTCSGDCPACTTQRTGPVRGLIGRIFRR